MTTEQAVQQEPYKLRPFQIENVQAGAARHVLVADDCGLGKTVSAIEIAKACRRDLFKSMWRGLIICPKSVRLQWLKELSRQDPTIPVRIVEYGETIAKDSYGWHIMHYEALTHKPPVQYVWDIVIADEAHRLRNRKAQRTIAIKKLSSIKRVALTGTPMDKDPAEMWSILNWLYPSEFTSYWKFRDMYVEVETDFWGYKKAKGPKNEAHLARLLKNRFLRHTKEMVATQLPPKVFVDVPLQMGEHQAKLYHQIRTTKDLEVKTDQGKLVVASELVRFVRMQQVASAPANLGDKYAEITSCKIDWTFDFITDNPDKYIVVFARFVRTAEEVHQMLLGANIEHDCYFGGSAKSQFPMRFAMGGVKVLVATIAMAGEGLDLKHAHAAIFIDQEWSTIKMQQAYDRIHRMGATFTKFLYMLRCSPVDELIAEAIEKKWDDAQLIYNAIERNVLVREA